MVSLKVKVENVERLRGKLRAIGRDVDAAVGEAVAEGAQLVARDAKQAGNALADDIVAVADADGFGARVEARSARAKELEFGSTGSAARPFLQPALERNRNAITRIVSRKLRDALRKSR